MSKFYPFSLMKISIFMNEFKKLRKKRNIMWNMARVTYVVTLKLSQSFKDKRCEGLKSKLYRGHVERSTLMVF